MWGQPPSAVRPSETRRRNGPPPHLNLGAPPNAVFVGWEPAQAWEPNSVIPSEASSRAKPFFRRSEGSRAKRLDCPRKIPRPAGEGAGLRDDAPY